MNRETDQTPDSEAKSGADKTWDQVRGRLKDLPDFAADTAACVRFFSRLPVPKINALDDPGAAPDFARIARAAPLAGFVIALPAAGCGMLLGYTHLPGLAVAAIVAALLAIITGALHEDGLSDVADGFFGGATHEKRLEIMKDSRIGAFGALALVLSAVLRVALLTALWQRFGPADAALLFLSGEALSRTLLVWQWHLLPLARPQGLAARFGKPEEKTVHQAALVTIPLLIPATLLLSLTAFSLACLFAAGATYATGRLARAKIGGVTGDVLGAMQQLGGLGFLLGVLMVP
ncbi:adenosylcobinamide-GDP ribazoletransferase [Roseibium marinum]|uniref:Adenosylcobinamide-GDP ribazoletransferase n=1 Tax=Roseibium marinum TaxID=281252 RepID=A0A2S3UN42_9HYPH|nr:adenosylcobinamide-GDP ribazoletransferase [Roseibium marinum]POF29138.1 adenosylcobinamide-GDP ribazoletransferase [Roseibium marinum]